MSARKDKKRMLQLLTSTSVRDSTASNTVNLCMRLTFEGAFAGCKISMTNQMLPRGRNNNNSSSHELPRVNRTRLLRLKCG